MITVINQVNKLSLQTNTTTLRLIDGRPVLVQNAPRTTLQVQQVKPTLVAGALQGPQGTQGPQGEQGLQGIQGPPGAVGPGGGLLEVADDLSPELGGDLDLGAFNINGQLENTGLIIDGGLL